MMMELLVELLGSGLTSLHSAAPVNLNARLELETGRTFPFAGGAHCQNVVMLDLTPLV